MRSRFFLGSGAALAMVIVAGACSSTLGPPTATVDNVVDTVTLYALTGTPVGTPSAYNIQAPGPVRTDSEPGYDFSFDLTGGQGALYPQGALFGLGRTSALQYANSFDATTTAPTAGWNDSTALNVSVGTVVLVRSRVITCSTYAATVFEYAKLQVLAIDTVGRTINFQILSDVNCGYRDLNTGIPAH